MWARVIRPRWPTSELLVDPQHALLYCPIPKVACSSLKRWFGLLAGMSPASLQPDLHASLRRELSLGRFSKAQAAAQARSHLFKFVFVRNPWDRLASAFLNKFVPGKAPALRALAELRTRESWGGQARSLCDRLAVCCGQRPPFVRELEHEVARFTFRDFVTYLATADLTRVDKHWRPQHLFLGSLKYDFVGRFEELASDFLLLCQRAGVPGELPHVNRTAHPRYATRPECYSDTPAGELRRLRTWPCNREFYTPDLIAKVARIYRQDIERFGYRFDERPMRIAAAA